MGKSTDSSLQKPASDIMHTPVFRLAWPMLIQYILALILGYTDTLMISGYQQTAVGAIGIADQVISFLVLAFSVISSASGVVVAQYLGAGRREKLNQIYTVCLLFNLCLSLVISAILLWGGGLILTLLQTPADLMPDALQYLQIVGGFLFMQAMMDTLSRFFQSNGKTTYGLITSFGMDVLNVLGNYLFLYGPLRGLHLGVTGVAISTTVSRFLMMLVSLVLFRFCIRGRISLRLLRPFPTAMLRTLLRLGLPSTGENVSYYMSQLFVTGFVNTLGIIAINTKIYINILSNISYMYSLAVAMSMTIIVGHAVGAGAYDLAYHRVRKTVGFALLLSLALALANYLLSPYTLALFTHSQDSAPYAAQIITLGRRILLIVVFLEIGRTLNLIVINSLKAAGDVKFPTVIGIISMWICSVGGGYLLGIVCGLGLPGIWMAMAADEIIRGVIVAIRWRRGAWRTKSIVSPAKKADEESSALPSDYV